ncbi:hypothetical protein GJU40_10985 [Bacillus lacus]|uniref:Uncharacterized protein n=1 Tax=Metabacillus lacus TaxID=1983721 RepID=A0A7X2J053_9BACI|nr:hypothetical protein [Metabacillus lacus]MRX72672.1 hypothetical protein [Metabacillus lacus]
MRNKTIFFLLVLIGLFFTYLAVMEKGGIDMNIGYGFVALVAYVESYIALKKK